MSTLGFRIAIDYTWPGEPRYSLHKIASDFQRKWWEVDRSELREQPGEPLEAAILRYVREKFRRDAKLSHFAVLDSAPFTLKLGSLIIEDLTDDEAARG